MLEYRIAGAQFLAVAIIGACAVVALLIVYLRAEGRARTRGSWGVMLVVVSPVLKTINQSLSVYAVGPVVAAVGTAVWVLVAVAGIIVLASALRGRVRGQARVLGVVGTLLIALGVLTRFVYQPIADRYLGQTDDELVITALAVDIVAGALLTGVGLLLAARALAVAARLPRLRRRTPGDRGSR